MKKTTNALILLHGTSSTGKTSTAHALQMIFPLPLIYLGLDSWITQCLSPRYYEPATRIEDIKQNPDVKLGTHFILPCTSENPLPWPMVGSGPVADDAIEVMYDAAVDYYQKGYWVIMDHVLIKPLWRDRFLQKTAHCRRLLVAMHAEDATLASREQKRGDRMPNIHLALAASIHQGLTYDLSLETSEMTPQECAETLLNFAKTHYLR